MSEIRMCPFSAGNSLQSGAPVSSERFVMNGEIDEINRIIGMFSRRMGSLRIA